MASRPRFYTSEEFLDEIYADPGSDFDSESSSDEIEEYHDQQSFSESSESEEMSKNDDQQSINNEDQKVTTIKSRSESTYHRQFLCHLDFGTFDYANSLIYYTQDFRV